MAHHKSAIKRIRQTAKKRLFNRSFKHTLKMAVRAVRESKTYDEAFENFKKATSIMDRIAAKHIVHKNTIANKKSNLYKFVASLKQVA